MSECNENNSYLEIIMIFVETNVLNQPFDLIRIPRLPINAFNYESST